MNIDNLTFVNTIVILYYIIKGGFLMKKTFFYITIPIVTGTIISLATNPESLKALGKKINEVNDYLASFDGTIHELQVESGRSILNNYLYNDILYIDSEYNTLLFSNTIDFDVLSGKDLVKYLNDNNIKCFRFDNQYFTKEKDNIAFYTTYDYFQPFTVYTSSDEFKYLNGTMIRTNTMGYDDLSDYSLIMDIDNTKTFNVDNQIKYQGEFKLILKK